MTHLIQVRQAEAWFSELVNALYVGAPFVWMFVALLVRLLQAHGFRSQNSRP